MSDAWLNLTYGYFRGSNVTVGKLGPHKQNCDGRVTFRLPSKLCLTSCVAVVSGPQIELAGKIM